MEIEIREKEKRIYVWLTRAESEDGGVSRALQPLYEAFRAEKYLVAVFRSGTEDLRELTRDLLLYNKVRLRELEMEKERRADGA